MQFCFWFTIKQYRETVLNNLNNRKILSQYFKTLLNFEAPVPSFEFYMQKTVMKNNKALGKRI